MVRVDIESVSGSRLIGAPLESGQRSRSDKPRDLIVLAITGTWSRAESVRNQVRGGDFRPHYIVARSGLLFRGVSLDRNPTIPGDSAPLAKEIKPGAEIEGKRQHRKPGPGPRVLLVALCHRGACGWQEAERRATSQYGVTNGHEQVSGAQAHATRELLAALCGVDQRTAVLPWQAIARGASPHHALPGYLMPEAAPVPIVRGTSKGWRVDG